MKRTLLKLISTAAALTFITPLGVKAQETSADYTFEYRTVESGAIITGVNASDSDIKSIEIPAEISDESNTYNVVGVDDLAFADLDNLTSITAPDSLKIDYMGNIAFLTSNSIVAYISSELGEDPDEKTFYTYVASKLQYNGKTENFTDEELAKVEERFREKAILAGVAEGDEVNDAVIKIIRNRDKINLSDSNLAKFELWIASIQYHELTVYAKPDTDIHKYLSGREFLGIKFSPTVLIGDANLDGEVNVRDCAAIASALAKGKGNELPENSDYNNDGEINVRDAAALASALASLNSDK